MGRRFKLSAIALRDAATILSDLHSQRSAEAANEVERQLFEAFGDLARIKTLGHRREDLTLEDALFYAVKPYVILLRQSVKYTRILRVAHGARNLTQLI